MAGPQLSYLLETRRQGNTIFESTSGVVDPAIWFPGRISVRGTDDYYRWELGAAAGVGYQATARLGLELRYATGLTPVRRPQVYGTTIPNKQAEGIRNTSLQAQVSYLFGSL